MSGMKALDPGRRMQLSSTLRVDDHGWLLTEMGWDPDHAVVVGSNFLCGNGYLGYRGTTPEQEADDFVALVVSDTYDCADGRWRELSTAPNPLYVGAQIDGTPIGVSSGSGVETSIDLRTGRFESRYRQDIDGRSVAIEVERFASYDELHLLAQRWKLRAEADVVVEVAAGIDSDIWSLNGQHLPSVDLREEQQTLIAEGRTSESGIVIVATSSAEIDSDGRVLDTFSTITPDTALRRSRIELGAGQTVVVDTMAVVMSSNDVTDPASEALAVTSRCRAGGHDSAARASDAQWEERWAAMDIEIVGDIVDQVGARFAAYHNRICTPAHADDLPIGARGLSCQAYQGAAFWDQEVYNLPAFLFTEPDIARSILAYRHQTLDGARRKAARLGYNGAYYAWISGKTGDELCPDHFFEDVLTGRPIRNHFNVWQIHVSPDIVTTLARYVEVTGDEAFLIEQGAELAFEVARFLHSFVRYDEWRQMYHCIRLLGPDEWHENVDDNAFTNHQTQAALSFAVSTYELLEAKYPARLETLRAHLGIDNAEIDAWRRVRDHIYLPRPDERGLIEQFAGFFELEDVTPEEVATRLLHPEEYWGWPNGVAVATQVSKQADVAMLLWLHLDRFDAATIKANYDYYEPRCGHRSSLSHAAHGMVAARLGETEAAHRHFRETATVDLLNTQHAVVGGTFIGGVHTAACGGTYQLAVQGFGGLDFRDGRLHVNPRLPAAWSTLSYPVAWRNQALRVTVEAGPPTAVTIAAAMSNTEPVDAMVHGEVVTVPPAGSVSVQRSRPDGS